MAQVRRRVGTGRLFARGPIPGGPLPLRMAEALGRQPWLEPVARVVGAIVGAIYRTMGRPGQVLKNVLHGTWLAHPLHSVLTDLPIGAWTVALVLDLVGLAGGRRDLVGPTNLVVAIGLAGALGAIVTGLTDWQHTDRMPRRLGIAHGLINLIATACYAVSLLYRRPDDWPIAVALRLAGYLVLLGGAYLGGHLVYGHRIGVTHAADGNRAGTEEFVDVIASADLPDGRPARVQARAVPVMVVRLGAHIFALGDTCAHLGCSISEGRLEGESIVCPCHGSRYALRDGRVLTGPATLLQPVFAARVRNGHIEIGLGGPRPD